METRAADVANALLHIGGFHREVAGLLAACDAWCSARQGWTPRSDLASGPVSFRLDQPERWMPGTADRWYRTGEPQCLAYVAVVWRDGAEVLDEPVVRTGVVRCVAEQPPPRWVAWRQPILPDVGWVQVPPRIDVGIVVHRARAIRLALVGSAELVRDVLQPVAQAVGAGPGRMATLQRGP
jgi:hypothetical protein